MGGDGEDAGGFGEAGGLGGFGGMSDAGAAAAMGGFNVGGFGNAFGGGLDAGDGGFGGMAADVAADSFGLGGLADMGFGPAAGFGAPEGVANVFGEGISDSENNPMSSSMSEKLRAIIKNPVVSTIVGLLSKTNPALAGLASIANIATSTNPAKDSAVTLGNLFGSKLGMGVPMVGGLGTMMGMAHSAPGGTGQSMGSVSSGGGMNLSDMASGLAGIYSGYRGMQDNSRMMGGLQSLYSQNSPYAKAMRQQLERKDAAAGRRSQYGPREVELQAKLAQLASGQIPALSQMQNNQALMRAAMLKSGLGFAQKMGLFDKLQGGLNNMLYPMTSGMGQGMNTDNMFNGQFMPSMGDNGGYSLPEFNWGM